jgi:predicted transglutaminase-like cysteine proteinase
MKKSLLLLATFIGLSSATCFADALLLTVNATPYDRQMERIRPVLTTASNASADRTSVAVVNEWMTDLREIPYAYQLIWKTPSEVESRDPADCKGKAVALYQRMRANGATNVRLVIGKRAPTSRMTHAWLVWETSNGSFVLDPTFNYSVTRAEKIGRSSYVPLYAYAGSKKFRATSNLVASN